MFKPGRILVPTDMSEHSNKAIREALDIAKQYNSEVILLHVIKEPVQQCTVDYCISEGLLEQLNRELTDAARKNIADQLAKVGGVDGLKITTDVRTGVPYDEIINEAAEKNVDLLVISPLGATGLAKYIMGSVTRHVLLGAKCPVLLLK
ncbi:MAG: universal stress protein [Deltaproteobacteria bacterium]|nr:universal stress protein [Deltaproteobacteria bacterium]TLN02946.1 MAG: universal stress protein [bacterium]